MQDKSYSYLLKEFGEYWGPGHPDYTLDDWKYEVANNDTRKGYWEWVLKQLSDNQD